MLRAINAVNSLLGTVLGLAIVALLSAGGWFLWQSHYADQYALQQSQETVAEQESKIADLSEQVQLGQEQISTLKGDLSASQHKLQQTERKVAEQAEAIVALEKDVAAQKVEIQRLETSIRLLKVDHRIARLTVLDQQGSAEEGDLATKVRFVEVDAQGKPLGQPREFTIEGDVVYIDAWVVKFDDTHVEEADPLRATSICLFRRLFGETQQPKQGFELDQVGSRPAAYQSGGDQMTDLERKLWARFWDYANNPAKAKEAGVRAAHGEAPSIKLLPDHSYKVLLRASGGLSIVAEPAASKTGTGNVY